MCHSIQRRQSETDTDTYDTVIVGVGPGGLFAAHALLRTAPDTRILLIDSGRSLRERQKLPPIDLGGAGGAGIYLGGRFYLGPAAIPYVPPVTAPDTMRPILEGDAYLRRASEVDAILQSYGGATERREGPSDQLAAAVAAARDAGLEYTISYPTRIVPAEQRRVALGKMLDDLEGQGASIAFGTTVVNTRRDDSGFVLTLSSGADEAPTREIAAHALVLAPGRYGAEWLVDTANALGTHVTELPVAFGVRLEMPAEAYQPLTEINPDPRLQLTLSGDAVIKTYATCPGGLVTGIERYGRYVASGVPLPIGERGPNTTVALLLQPGVKGTSGEWPSGEEYARILNERYNRTLIVQRLGDLRQRRATTDASLATNSVRPSCDSAQPGDLNDVYPPQFWRAMDELLERISRLAPNLQSDDALVYGPAEERFWHFPTDEQLQTAVPGLFVAGDGPGQSQGAVQAGVAGLLAGAGVANYLSSRST